jgi:polyhydroxyalkanoic acid synthase PhaR subunit
MSEETGNRSPLYEVEEQWKQWYDASSKVWSEAAIPIDPFTFFKQWYESSHETWSKAIEEIIGNEKFVEAASHYVESYTTFYKNFRSLNEDYFSHLQLTTRSDLTRVAEMIITLENKVDSIQDAFEDFQSQYPQFATLASIQHLTIHQQALEQKLDALPGLDARLNDIEEKLNALPATLIRNESSAHLEKRLDGVEQKLDTLVMMFERMNTSQTAVKATATRTSRSSNPKTRTSSKTPEVKSEETPSSIEK